jgi:uncharacterized Zn-binding protein involved in type VI secretion
MPGVARKGLDNAQGGVITGPSEVTVLVNGAPISVVGDTVTTHGKSPHVEGTAIIVTGSSTVKAGGKDVALAQSSQLTCGHTLAPGSSNVKAT